MDAFAAATAERLRLADDLSLLAPQQWEADSLCAGWSVRVVAGHLVSALSPSLLPFAVALVRARGRLDRATGPLARRTAAQPTDDLVAALRARAGVRAAPPLVGPRGPLTDVLVHAGDVRLPLGLPHDPGADAVALALAFVTAGRPVGFVPRGRLAGLALVADDLGGRWGAGPEVLGRGVDLLMAACGRTAVLDRLRGAGASVLSERLGAGP